MFSLGWGLLEMEWKQEKPSWCPYPECIFKRKVMDAMCGGQLPKPEPHDEDFNPHRICIMNVLPCGEVFDLLVNTGDLYHFRRVFDALDGRGIGSGVK